jgi:hypothetical protein
MTENGRVADVTVEEAVKTVRRELVFFPERDRVV